MGNRLAGKIALVTAAAQGIGRASVLRFASEGARVWGTDINQAGLVALVEENTELAPSITTHLLDVRNTDAVNALAEKVGTIDVLFNCAGYVHQGDIFACSEKDWDFSFDVNVSSMYRTCRAFLPAMLEAGKGSIINMASVVSSVKGAPEPLCLWSYEGCGHRSHKGDCS